jgi:hypothetical protein
MWPWLSVSICMNNQTSRPVRLRPGVEMQHDTSPHEVTLGSRRRAVQTASLVLGYSRMRLLQCYPTWNRFWCKVFPTEALVFLGGAAGRCIVDNSSE